MLASAALAPPATQHTSAYVSIRLHTSAYVSIRQHASACFSIRQHTSAYVSIRRAAALCLTLAPLRLQPRSSSAVSICTFVLVKQVNGVPENLYQNAASICTFVLVKQCKASKLKQVNGVPGGRGRRERISLRMPPLTNLC
jgi:hypothetical protein